MPHTDDQQPHCMLDGGHPTSSCIHALPPQFGRKHGRSNGYPPRYAKNTQGHGCSFLTRSYEGCAQRHARGPPRHPASYPDHNKRWYAWQSFVNKPFVYKLRATHGAIGANNEPTHAQPCIVLPVYQASSESDIPACRTPQYRFPRLQY